MKLILEPLERAINQLKKGIIEKEKRSNSEIIRDGVIQRFEYTVDLSWKILQRHLKQNLQIDELSIRSKKDLFREAAKLQAIDDAEPWIFHYESRNSTSHIYDEIIATKVYERAKLFLIDVKKLLEYLKKCQLISLQDI